MKQRQPQSAEAPSGAPHDSVPIIDQPLFDDLPVPEPSENPGGHMCPRSLLGRPDIVALWDRNQVLRSDDTDCCCTVFCTATLS